MMQRRLLWLGLVLLLPLPYALTDVGWVPAVRLLVMGGVTTAVWVVEGELLAGLIGGVLLFQGIVQVVVCRALASALLRRVSATKHWLAVVLVLLVLVAAAQWPIYRTPLSAQSARATMWQVFD